MASLLSRIFGARPPENKNPYNEVGASGTAIVGGRIQRGERNAKLVGAKRFETSADIMTNFSIVAASLRAIANLTARPNWKFNPPNDSTEAKDAAAFMESVINGTDTSWSRLVKRKSMYRYHGFGAHEWAAVKRDDGKIGIGSIEVRPPQTIDRWDLDEQFSVIGMWQRAPVTGEDIYLPRQKLIYLVDDVLSDSPEGLGMFRHLVEPTERMKAYLKREGIGYQRDMGGIPIGRAPLLALKQSFVAQGKSEKEAEQLAQTAVGGLKEFVNTKAVEPDSSLILDSTPYTTKGGDGQTQISQTMQWGLELLSGTPGALEEIGKAISRLTFEMATIMGTERLLVGSDGKGSLALSQDTSRNLFLNINSTLGDIAETVDRDITGPMWALNGFDDKLKPKASVEDAAFRDVAEMTAGLRDMAMAGATLAPDDPCINEIRDLWALSHQPEMTPERLAMFGHASGANPNVGDPFADPGKDPKNNPDEPLKPNEPAGGDN